MGDLHVFKNDVIDWVVASDAADAAVVWAKHTGEPYDEDENGGPWEQLPDDKVLWVRDEGGREEKTCAAWAAQLGRGFLASTEY